MKTPIFDYSAPATLAEAIDLLQERAAARPLAGGQSLLVDLKLNRRSAGLLVDLGKLPELRNITVSAITSQQSPAAPKATVIIGADTTLEETTGLTIGAMTTCSEVAAHPAIQARYTALAEAAASIGDEQVRNAGTLGGGLAQNDPTGDLPAAVLALGGRLRLAGPTGLRTLTAHHFFIGARQTALQPAEIIVAIEFPAANGLTGSAYEKIKNPASDYALCGVAAYMELLPGKTICRVAVSGAFESTKELPEISEGLAGKLPTAEKIKTTVARARLAQPGMTDLFASGEYREHLVRVLAERALLKALERAQAAVNRPA